MKLLYPICLGLSMVLLASCAPKVQIEPAKLPKVVQCVDRCTVGLGVVAQFGTIFVIPKEVVEDSRCPINARCVWAGKVVLRANIGNDPDPGVLYRHPKFSSADVEMESTKPIWMVGHNFGLEEISPTNIAAGEAIKPEDYRFTISVEKANAPIVNR